MKDIIKNRKTLLVIIAALMFGGFMGWLVKPSSNQEEQHEAAAHSQEEHNEEVWTCSMHPQIRQPEPGNCPICGMELIPVSSARSGANTNSMALEMSPEAIALANVQTTKVTGVSPEGQVYLTGKIKADERRLASITAKFPGRIEELFVSFTGQAIRRGEKLATIYSPELLTAQRELLEAAKTKSTYPELYEAAREKLKLWKLTENQIEAIEKSGRVKDQFDVLADKGGIVTRRNVALGDYVGTGSVLLDIADLSRVWVMIDAFETDLPSIKLGNEVNFTVSAIPGKTFTAKVTYIDPVINPATRAASVRAETSNQNLELKPEMFVNARIQSSVNSGKSSLAIPRTALLWSGKRSVVYVKIPEAELPAFEMREITIGPRAGEMYLVEKGLEAGEEIVTNGVFAIDAAAQLAGKRSMMNREGGPAMTGHDHGKMTTETTSQKPESHEREMSVSENAKKALVPVIDKYLTLKNALVTDNFDKAKDEAKSLDEALGNVNMNLFQGESHNIWMSQSSNVDAAAKKLAQASGLEEARQQFIELSNSMITLVKTFKPLEDTLFVQHCPMADSNKGADWLSREKEIRNPYFGASMLTCGEVRSTIAK